MASDTLKSVKKIDKKGKPQQKKPGFFSGISKFFKDIFAELKRVTWPTKKELISSTISVIVFVIIMSAFTGGLDLIFSSMMKLLVS